MIHSTKNQILTICSWFMINHCINSKRKDQEKYFKNKINLLLLTFYAQKLKNM